MTRRGLRSIRLEIPQRQIDQLLFELRVRRVEKLDRAESRRLLEDAAGVGEGFEAETAVRFADAALADAAEREVELVEVDEGVVDDGAAGAGAADDVADDALAAAEDVEDERMFAGLDDAEGVVDRAVRHHRQHRAENLLLH